MELTEKTIELYSTRFDKSYYAAFRDRINKTLELIDSKQGKLLDIGCGDGFLLKLIQKNSNLSLYGTDIVKKHLLELEKQNIKTSCVDLNTQPLPFKENFFDFVVIEEVLEHVFDNEKLLEEIHRVLKPNASMIISVPNMGAWYNRFLLFFGFMPHFVESGSTKIYGTPFGVFDGHVKGFTERSIVEMLVDKKFSIEKIKGCVFDPRPVRENSKFQRIGTNSLYCIEKVLGKRASLATNILIKAKALK